MSTSYNDNTVTRTAADEPDPHGQAALLLAESILHALVEKQVFSTAEAIGIVRTACEVAVEVAFDNGEPDGCMIQSLNRLAAIARSFEADNGSKKSS